MKNIIFALALSVASLSPFVAQAQEGQDLSVDLHGALNISSYTGTNISGGMGSNFGIHPVYFFHKSLGIFTGLDHVSRPMSLNSTESIKSLEIPFGLMFRGSPGDLNLVGLGVSIDMPLNDFKDSSRTYETNGGMSLLVVTNRYYAINSNLSLGIYSDIRYSFHSPLKDASQADSRTFSFDIGLGARVNL